MAESLPGILAALVHELSQLLNIAQLAADRNPPQMALFWRALRRASRKCEMLGWLAQVYRGDPAAEQALAPKEVASVLDLLIGPIAALSSSVAMDMRVYAAPTALETVLENLLANACKHAPDATLSIQAQVLEETERPWPADAPVTLQGRKMLLTILDDGPSIGADVRPLLFQPIVRTTSGHERVGIGLWLSRVLVRAHGGDLWLDDSERGASFSCVWPYAPLRVRTRRKGARA